jgi:hypothetical protein
VAITRIRRVGVLSWGMVTGTLYAFIGLLAGGVVTLLALFGAALSKAAGNEHSAIGMLFGVGAVILLPICYGLLGFVGGLIGALLYNLAAGITGGVEIELA